MINKKSAPEGTHPGVKAFDELPDSANVPVQVVCALFGCSTATVWRRVRSGHLVAPRRFGMRTTRWSVADLRAALVKVKEPSVCR